jgi:D-tyrosyl-tRNA(Tyr) deacylase
MRAVLQRVTQASVTIDGEVVGAIERGLLVLLGVAATDTLAEARWLAEKVAGLRIFADDNGKMNRSIADVGGAVLVVSQFTLYGDCRKGRRPSFIAAAGPDVAVPLYEAFVDSLRASRRLSHRLWTQLRSGAGRTVPALLPRLAPPSGSLSLPPLPREIVWSLRRFGSGSG